MERKSVQNSLEVSIGSSLVRTWALMVLAAGLTLAAAPVVAEQLVESRESLYNNIFVYRDKTYVT